MFMPVLTPAIGLSAPGLNRAEPDTDASERDLRVVHAESNAHAGEFVEPRPPTVDAEVGGLFHGVTFKTWRHPVWVRRNPTLSSRSVGAMPPRKAARTTAAVELCHDPPRYTRRKVSVDLVGFTVTGTFLRGLLPGSRHRAGLRVP